ncbi:MAG: tRNA uridine-5-carboxymethylaminomethyl(34) synthesis GTPase MnmE [Alphaproteobacteria bacterium]
MPEPNSPNERRTIAALATAPGRSAIAIIRISGPKAREALGALIGSHKVEPRRAELLKIKDPTSGAMIDEGLVLWFPAPASFTGEDVVELQVHGSRAVVAGLLGVLAEDCGVELAEPGEFTRRAFDNGKLDLTQVEALADLIDAETEGQRRQALRQFEGVLGAKAEAWREQLIRASAFLEAAIDFPDEDLPGDSYARAAPIIARVDEEIAAALNDNRSGERMREGITIAIIGPPNAGKSTLLNALAKREVAIVSEHAGTTRDVIEVSLDLGGVPVILLDTAGLRDVADPVEQEGVRRARARAERADLRILLWDATQAPADWSSLGLEPKPQDLLVYAKADLAQPAVHDHSIAVSAKAGLGLASLIAAIAAAARDKVNAGMNSLVTRARHRQELARAEAALRSALRAGTDRTELMAEDVRTAAHALGRLTGRIDVEEILDVVFAEFCLGK